MQLLWFWEIYIPRHRVYFKMWLSPSRIPHLSDGFALWGRGPPASAQSMTWAFRKCSLLPPSSPPPGPHLRSRNTLPLLAAPFIECFISANRIPSLVFPSVNHRATHLSIYLYTQLLPSSSRNLQIIKREMTCWENYFNFLDIQFLCPIKSDILRVMNADSGDDPLSELFSTSSGMRCATTFYSMSAHMWNEVTLALSRKKKNPPCNSWA